MQPCPLKHTDVQASVAGYIASVEVKQQFHNPFSEKIEAVYVFPLPENAAVNEFIMTVGTRRIRGIVREREQAKQIYEAAKAQGYVASLLSQERPNIFTQSVANIESGKQIDISIRYFNTLKFVDGWYEFVFPMVVGPRFNPPATTDGIGAVGPGARGASGQPNEISYLPPDRRTGHDISLHLALEPGVLPSAMLSRNHDVSIVCGGGEAVAVPAAQTLQTMAGSFAEDPNRRHYIVDLARHDSLPNKDFVFRWQVAGDTIKSSAFVATASARATEHEAGDASAAGGNDPSGSNYVSLLIVPPAELANLPAAPLEFVFTLDVSGSMSGRPIEQARAAMRQALSRLNAHDLFQVVKFAGSAEQMAPRSVPATPQNIERAMRYVERAEAGGGTMMLDGMRRSLATPREEGRTRVVCFLTDGYIGNESQILSAMSGWLGDARVFSFGVGSSTNRYLMEAMAKLGSGAAAYVGVDDDPTEAMNAFFDRVRHPAMTDLAIEINGRAVPEAFPRRIPDLWVGRPMQVTAKVDGPPPTAVRLRGRLAGRTWETDVLVQAANPLAAKAMAPVWARSKIADLGEAAMLRPDADLPQQVKQVALEYGLLSSFTSFVAVDGTVRTAGDHGVTTPVPVPVPDGVRYDTTVAEGQPNPS